MDASFDPLRLPFLPPCRGKNLGQGSPGMLTIAFSPLPVEELVISGLPCEGKELSFSNGQMVLDAGQLPSLATPPAVQADQGSSGYVALRLT